MTVYFSGLGGVGIGPLAIIARDAGYAVVGSDLAESLVTKELRDQNVTVNIGQDGTFLRATHEATPIEWFVYTSALPDDHPELLIAKELGIRTSKRDEFLAQLLKEKDVKLIAVTGTHGKTTTTGMLVWAFQQLGLPLSYSVGSTITFGFSGAYDPKSEYFIYECDEYDRNFLHFSPYLAIIPSVDYDHPDTFPTEASYKEAFDIFLSQSQHVITWQNDADYLSLKDKAWILPEGDVSSVSIPGTHNRRNATLVLKALEYLGLGDEARNQAILSNFPGTDRRFEKLADNFYTDYGHHPAEIEATLELAREVADHVVLVYQPHQNQRQHLIRDQYVAQFEAADDVYWLPTYLTRERPDQAILTPAELTINVTNKDHVHEAELDDALWAIVQDARKAGKLVLLMGAGTIDAWGRQKLAES